MNPKFLDEKVKMIKDGVALLEKFLTDFQFNEADERYCGFLNVGIPDVVIGEEDYVTFRFICNNPNIFESILKELGGDTESGFHEEETIFIKLKK